MPNLIPLTHFTKSAAITKRSLADGHFQRFSISVHETNGGDTRMDNKSLFSHYADVHEACFPGRSLLLVRRGRFRASG
jgi:hypothetical protein